MSFRAAKGRLMIVYLPNDEVSRVQLSILISSNDPLTLKTSVFDLL